MPNYSEYPLHLGTFTLGSRVRLKKDHNYEGGIVRIDPSCHPPTIHFLCGNDIYSYPASELELVAQTPENFDPEVGAKFDSNKPNWSLMPWEALSQVQEIIDYGAKKYAPNNWRKVEPWRERYFSAVMRHLLAWQSGEKTDPESGKSHLAHAICSLLFMLWREGNG